MRIRYFVSFALLVGLAGSLTSCFHRFDKKGVTYGMASRIADVAKKNDKNVTVNSLLESLNYNGGENFTNERMLLLLRKAFPNLKEPSTYYTGLSEESDLINWGNLSDNLLEAIDYFQRRAIYFPLRHCNQNEGGGHFNVFSPEGIARRGDLEITLRRIQGYIGANPEDDFYSYVNHEQLFSSNDVGQNNFIDKTIIHKNVESFIAAMKNDDPNKQRINNFIDGFSNEEKKKENLGGLLRVVESYNRKSPDGGNLSVNEHKTKIFNFLKKYANEDKQSILAPFAGVLKLPPVATEPNHKKEKMVNYMVLDNPFLPSMSDWSSNLGKRKMLLRAATSFSIYAEHQSIDYNKVFKDYRNFINKYFNHLEPLLFETQSPQKPFTPLPFKPLNKMKLDLSDDVRMWSIKFSLKECYDGFDTTRILLRNPYHIEALFKTLNGAEAEEIEAFLIYSYIQNYPYCFPSEDQSRILLARGEGVDKDRWSSLLPYIANELLDSYGKSEKCKKQLQVLTDLFKNLKETMKTRFQNNDWLDKDGKTKVLKKLDNMTAVIINKNITKENGKETNYKLPVHDYKVGENDIYDNCNLFTRKKILSIKDELGSADEKATILTSNPFMANAYNEVSSNMIHIPPGYVFSKKSAEEETMEELLCDYGFVIGHEMTHSFDNNGARYDENGLPNEEWLSKKNNLEFAKKNKQVAQFYSVFEEIPGFRERGRLKVSEATADLGGFNMILDIAKKKQGFNYKNLFTSLAKMNFIHINRPIYIQSIMNDPHPIGGGRINPLLMNSPEFKKEYNVKPGDYMYLPEEKQVSVW